MKKETGRVTRNVLKTGLTNLKAFKDLFSEEEVGDTVAKVHPDAEEDIDFEAFLRVSQITIESSL